MVESSDAGALVLPADLEAPLAALETQLAALDAALRQPRDGAVDRVAAQLHEALAQAVQRFQGAAREGGVPAALRHRLALAGAEVAAQREALARATAALDRAIDVQVSRLRKLIEPDPASPRYLQTVWGFGYVFVPDGKEK